MRRIDEECADQEKRLAKMNSEEGFVFLHRTKVDWENDQDIEEASTRLRGGVKSRRLQKLVEFAREVFLLPRNLIRNARDERNQKKLAKMQEDLNTRGWSDEEWKANTALANKLLGDP